MGTTHKNKERLRTTFFSDEQFKLLCDVLEKFEVLYPGQKRTEPAALEIFALHSKLLDLQKLNRSQISGHFEWIDSILISAMKKGDWILIDNVNLCSSSVLDRLNPLLEPNGNIILNERGMVDGKTPKIVPHPNFRIFFTMDPKNGEISRAMRNRCAEICLTPTRDNSQDTLILLEATGITSARLPQLMINFHENLQAKPLMANVWTLRDLIHWANLFLEQFNRGLPLKKSLFSAAKQAYQRAASDLISENLQTFFPSNTLRELRTELRPQIPRPPYGYGDNSDAVAFGNQLRTFFHYLAAQKQSEPKGVETIRKSLFFAAEHIIALTSCNTAEFRMRWFNHAQEVGITSGDLSETIAKTIGVLAFHPLVSGSRELVERTKANKRGSLNLDGHPFQLLTNEPLVYEVRRSLIHNRKETEWTSIESAYDRMPVLISRLLQKSYEKPTTKTDSKMSFKTYSVLQQSYAYHAKKINAQVLKSPKIIPLVAPFFEAVDEMFENWLTNLSLFFNFDLLKLVQHVITLRNRFWSDLEKSVDINFANFSLYVTWIGKQLSKIVQIQNSVVENTFESNYANKLIALTPSLSAVLSALQEQIRNEFGAEFKSVLWKFSKYLPIRDGEIRNIYDTLANFRYPEAEKPPELAVTNSLLEQEFDGSERSRVARDQPCTAEKDSENFLAPKDKRMLLEGMTTLRWLDLNGAEDGSEKSPAESDGADPANMEMQQTTEEKEKFNKDRKKLITTLTALPSTLSSNPSSTDPFSSLSTSPHINLLSTHQSLIHELYQLIEICEFLKTKEDREEFDDMEVESAVDETIERLRENLDSFLNFGIDQTSRQISDFSGYHRLLWILESRSSPESGKLSVYDLRNIFSELLFSFQHRTWNNNMNFFIPYLESTSERLSRHEYAQRGNMFKKSTGVPRLLNSFQSSVISFVLYDSQTSIKISERHENAETVKKVLKFLEVNRSDFPSLTSRYAVVLKSPEDADWELFCHVLAQTMIAFMPFFEGSQCSTVIEFLEVVRSMKRESRLTREMCSAVLAIIQSCKDAKFCEFSAKFLVPVLKIFKELSASAKPVIGADVAGKLWIFLGLLRIYLYLPAQPVDPAQKYFEKGAHLKSVVGDINTEIRVCEEEEKVFTGKAINQKIEKLKLRKKDLLEKFRKMNSKTIARQNPERFSDLYSTITQFISNSLSQEKIEYLITEISELSGKNAFKFRTVLAQEVLWQENTDLFIKKVTNTFGEDFGDITKNFCASLYHIKSGVKMLLNQKFSQIPVTACLSQKKAERLTDLALDTETTLFGVERKVESVLRLLLQFPSNPSRLLQQIPHIFSDSSLNFIEVLVKVNKIRANHPVVLGISQLTTILLRCALCLAYGLLVTRSSFARSLINSSSGASSFIEIFDVLFTSFVHSHHKFQEYQRRKEEEENQTFKYKTRLVKVETEEEREARRLKELFPDYEGDFEDLLEEDKNSDDEITETEKETEKVTPVEETLTKNEKVLELPSNALFQLCQVHKIIFGFFGDCVGNTPPQLKTNQISERLATFKLIYNCACELFKGMMYEAPFEVDSETHGAHLLMASEVHKELQLVEKSMPPIPTLYGEKKPTGRRSRKVSDSPEVFGDFSISESHLSENFYHRVDVVETGLTMIPLERFSKRVFELRELFPENLVLAQISKVIERIISFPLKSQVSKILAGLDLLLLKAQAWESVSPKMHSLAEHMSEIISIIARWRRQELEHWPLLLRMKEEDYETKARKWWFYLYNLLLLREDKSDIHRVLSEFFESSSFGEFPTRLRLLRSFQKQLKLEQSLAYDRGYRSEIIRNHLVNYTYNIYKYYAQFLPRLYTTIASMRKPLEDDLRDQVKLGQWDHRSYYRMKDSIARTRTFLAKTVKDYENILNKPVDEVLNSDRRKSVDEEEAEAEENANKGKKGGKKAKKFEPVVLPTKNFIVLPVSPSSLPESFCEESLIATGIDFSEQSLKITRIASRMRKICSDSIVVELMRKSDQDLANLSILGNTVIEYSAELRASSELRNQPQKKRALIDLFNYLKEMGLSFHEAKILQSQKNIAQLMALPCPDPESLFGSQSATERELAHVSINAESYYYRNMSLMVKLRQAKNHASPDLSRLEVEKVTKYMEHLMTVIINQRSLWSTTVKWRHQLDQVARSYSKLSKEDIHEDVPFFPPQQNLRYNLGVLKHILDNFHYLLIELSLISGASREQNWSKLNGVVLNSLDSVEKMKTQVEEHLAVATVKSASSYVDPDAEIVATGDNMDIEGDESEISRNHHLLSFQPSTFISLSQKELLRIHKSLVETTTAPSTTATETSVSTVGTPFARHLRAVLGELIEDLKLIRSEQEENIDADKASKKERERKERDEKSLVIGFKKLVDELIATIQVATQTAKKIAEEKEVKKGDEQEAEAKKDEVMEEEEQGEGEEDKEGERKKKPSLPELPSPPEIVNLFTVQNRFVRFVNGLKIPKILKLTNDIDQVVSDISETKAKSSVLGALGNVVKAVTPMICQLLLLLDTQFYSFSTFHREEAKLHYILLTLSSSLLSEGFCTKVEDDRKEGDMVMDDKENAGMGEGEGVKDVSDQMDNEEQVMGEDYGHEEEEASKEKINQEEGIEMETEFDGTMHDLQDKEKQEDDESNSEESEEEEELDRQMGDTDKDKEEKIDERLWDDEKDEEEKQKTGNEEEMSDMKGREDDQEMMAKDEEGEDDDEEDKGKKEKKSEPKEQPGEKDEEEDQGGDEEGGSISEVEEEEEDKKDFQDDTWNDTYPNKQNEEDEEEFQLPDDLNLDGNEDDEEEGKRDEEEATEEKGGEEEEMTEMKEEKGKEGEDQGEEEKGKEDQAQEMEVEEEEKGEEREEERKEEGDKKVKDEDEDEEKKDEEQGEETKGEDEPVHQQDRPQDQEEVEKDQPAVGTKGQSNETVETVERDNEGHEEYQPNQQRQQQQHQKKPQQKQKDDKQEMATEQEQDKEGKDVHDQNKKDSSNTNNDDKKEEKENEKEKKRRQQDPNPYRSLADALKNWEKRLNPKDKPDQETEENKEDEDKKEEDNEMEEEKDEADEYEYMNKDDKEKEDATALGNATEEQLQEQETEKMTFNEEEEKKEEEKAEEDQPVEKMDEEDGTEEKGDEKKEDSTVNPKGSKLKNQKKADGEPESDDEGVEQNDKEEEEISGKEEEGEKEKEEREIVSTGKKGAKDIEPKEIEQELVPLTHEDLQKMREELMVKMAEWHKPGDDPEDNNRQALGLEIWRNLQKITGQLSQELCEQLRLLLEPTQTAKLKGDYRTGKRLNMRRVIPYIASNFKNDKIWLRRQKPSKREYQVLLGIDDSESVAIGGVGDLLREAVATITQAFMLLDVGQLSIVKFGEQVQLLHTFQESFTDSDAATVIPQLTFTQKKTNMARFLETSIQTLELTRQSSSTSTSANLMQLMFVLSDGRFGNEREYLKQWLRRAEEQQIFVVFLVLDGIDKNQSILDIQAIGKDSSGNLCLTPYIDGFPFAYYLLLRKIGNLPQVLADALRQWFEMIQRD